MAIKAPSKNKPAKTTSTALTKWEDKFQAAAVKAKAITGVIGGDFIGTQGGILTVDKVKVPNNTLNVIVLAHIFENGFYVGKFDPKNPQPPVCFALGDAEDAMKPHELSAEPQGEGAGCAQCPWNQWNSADTGKGKACRNGRRLAVIAADSIEGDISKAKVRYLKIPPTSLTAWDGYVQQMADTLHRPPWALVTNIKCVPGTPGGGTGFSFEISLDKRVEDETDDTAVFEALEAKAAEVEKLIDFPYQPLAAEDRAAAKKPGAGKVSKFSRTAPAKVVRRRS